MVVVRSNELVTLIFGQMLEIELAGATDINLVILVGGT
jgi:hypothetical protein